MQNEASFLLHRRRLTLPTCSSGRREALFPSTSSFSSPCYLPPSLYIYIYFPLLPSLFVGLLSFAAPT